MEESTVNAVQLDNSHIQHFNPLEGPSEHREASASPEMDESKCREEENFPPTKTDPLDESPSTHNHDIQVTHDDKLGLNSNKDGLSIRNLTYTVRNKKLNFVQRLSRKILRKDTRVKILNNVNVYIPKGNLTCIMGSSGSGKTSLLQTILYNRSPGKVTFQGKELTRKRFRKFSAYVEQHDVLLGSATVHETLTTASRLQGCPSARVAEVERLLGLLECRHTIVGNSMIRGISGGEKRRLSLGLALLNSPKLLLLDEITSGLDYFTTAKIISILKELAHREKKTIVTTLHQPAADVFFLFDQCIIMDKGRVIFDGTPNQLIKECEWIGYPVPAQVNPSDFILQLISNPFMVQSEAIIHLSENEYRLGIIEDLEVIPTPADTDGKVNIEKNVSSVEGQENSSKSKSIGDKLSTNSEQVELQIDTLSNCSLKEEENKMTRDILTYLEQEDELSDIELQKQKDEHRTKIRLLFSKCSKLRQQEVMENEKKENTVEVNNYAEKGTLRSDSSTHVFFITKILLLTKRFAVSSWRDPLVFWSELCQYVFIALFIGLLYLRPTLGTSDGLNDRIFALFFVAIGFSYVPSFVVLSAFPEQRELFLKERRSRFYSTLPYYTAYNLVHIPLEIFFPVVGMAILYWMVGLNDEQFYRPLIAVGVLILCQLASESMGLFVSSLIRSVDVGIIVMNGVFILSQPFAGNLVKDVKPFFKPLEYVSVFRYTLQALTVNEFSRSDFECQVPGQLDKNLKTTCSGEDVLNQIFTNGYSPIWVNCLVLFCMMVFFRILCYLSLRFKKWGE